MASCLDNLVGVRGCGSETRDYYVNDLTGINIPDFDKALNPEKTNATAALTTIIDTATKLVESDINLRLQNKYTLKTFIDNNVIGYYYDDKETILAETGYLTGYEIRVDKLEYVRFFISGVRLFVPYTGSVAVKIYDLIQGKLVDTVTVSAVSGEIVDVGEIDLSYYSKKQRLHLFIGYESNFSSYKTSYLSPYLGIPDGQSCPDLNCGVYRNGYVYFRSAKIATGALKISTNLEGNSYGAGLSMFYSLQCDFRQVLCNMRNLVALAIWYKAGELIMKELRRSKRLTGVVTVYKQDHAELEAEYRQDYERHFENMLLNMKMPESICFSCNPQVYSQTRLP